MVQLINKVKLLESFSFEYLELEDVGHWSFDEEVVKEKINNFLSTEK
jgi:hypothetical protein